MSDKPKPKVHLVGQDGNVFNLLGICIRALKKAGQSEESQELKNRVFGCGSYDEALAIMLEYVEEVGDDTEEGDYDCDDELDED
jgi:hypothetical protein